MSDPEVLCHTPAGDLRIGSGFKYKRKRGPIGHLVARGCDLQQRWIFAVDNRGLARTIEIEAVIRICDPPKPPKQREFKPRKNRWGRR
jgi:hypothetical protein